MTRINTVAVQDLTNEWLLAEWRELPRIVNELEKYPNRYKPKDTPPEFKLNDGHVKFFRDKLLFLAKRHRELCRECRKRGIKINRKLRVRLHYLRNDLKMFCCNDWTPTKRDHEILIERLQERFDERKEAYHMQDDVINCDKSFACYMNKHLSHYID